MEFSKAVKNGQFVVTTECRPPKAAQSDRLKACGAMLGGQVHAICAPESEDGARLCSLAACNHLAAAGAEPVLHLLTRDLNRIALQSTIMGAASMGIKNILCLSGRHQALTASGSARGVFDVDAVQLLQVADAMRKKAVLADGQEMDSPVELVLGTDTNPFAEPMDLQIITLDKAVNAGADFVITQPVFNIDKFNVWMDAVKQRNIHTRTCIIASVMPITSPQEAAHLAEKHRYLDIPKELIERVKTAGDRRAAGIHLAAETIAQLQKTDGVHGVHVMTGDNFELAANVISASGLSRS